MPRRLSIFKRGFELELSHSWYGPLTPVLLVFCVLWDGFLLIWYTYGVFTEDAMPGIYFLLPMIHVGVGFVVTYYVLCLLFNRTIVSVNNSHLRVRHKPIPWVKKDITIPSKTVKQVYVEERIDLRNRLYYVLRAILHNDEDIALMEIFETSTSIQQITVEVENYLDIEDRLLASAGYRNGKTSKRTGRAPRIVSNSKFQDSRGLEQAQVGHYLMYERQLYVVSHVTQYDWDNGDSDRLLQLITPKREQALVYVRQDKGLFHIYLESEVPTKKILQVGFDVLSAPVQLFFQGREYDLQSHRSGMAFYANQPDGISADQWTYLNEQGQEHFRITNNRGMIVAYLGKIVNTEAFGKVLIPD